MFCAFLRTTCIIVHFVIRYVYMKQQICPKIIVNSISLKCAQFSSPMAHYLHRVKTILLAVNFLTESSFNSVSMRCFSTTTDKRVIVFGCTGVGSAIADWCSNVNFAVSHCLRSDMFHC